MPTKMQKNEHKSRYDAKKHYLCSPTGFNAPWLFTGNAKPREDAYLKAMAKRSSYERLWKKQKE